MLSLYVHIPFCRRRCRYCDFATQVVDQDLLDPYLTALLADIKSLRALCATTTLTSVYLGGGTPLLLGIDRLMQLLAAITCAWQLSSDCEITLEVNPQDITQEELRTLRQAGVNRLSIGAQSFSDRILRLLGRRHENSDVDRVVAAARRAGFENINLDLIYAIPSQTMAEWRESLQRVQKLAPEHISTYGLHIAPQTPFGRAKKRGILPAAPTEDEVAGMWEWGHEFLAQAGYDHYEVSNFAWPGWECRHNLRYWHNKEYLAIGAAAHGYWQGWRWRNSLSMQDYIASFQTKLNGPFPTGHFPVAESDFVTATEAYIETMILGLRLSAGVNLAAVAARHGRPVTEAFPGAVECLLENGLCDIDAGSLRPTRKGLLLQNEICLHFV